MMSLLMENDWQKVFSTSKGYLAEIIKGVLIEHGIDSIVINKQDSSYLFGEVEVYTKKDNLLKAINIIKKNELDNE